MSVQYCLFNRYYRAVSTLPGVQPSFNASNCRAITVYRIFLPIKHAAVHNFLRQKRRVMQGRMGEVGPPRKRVGLFTEPYSHLRCSTVILLCEASHTA